MSEVKIRRWEPEAADDDAGTITMMARPSGQYVTYADCEALVKERDDLRAACRVMAEELHYRRWMADVASPASTVACMWNARDAVSANELASHFVRAAEGAANGEGA